MLGEFVINNEWVVSKLDAERRVKEYSENYTDINYTIVMTRRSDFYVMTMMFPCILVSAIAAIGKLETVFFCDQCSHAFLCVYFPLFI